jgi:hypothetical protein
LILPSVSGIAFAQYITTDGQTGLDDYLQLAQDRVTIANENPKAGSGTFGGVAATFFIRGRQGKYAAIGRG